jgi:methylmalonyl-CoA mutase N-terminal domain/subunit
MASTHELEDVVRQQREELDRLRAEVAEWRARYEGGGTRDVAFTNSATEVAPLYTALDLEGSGGSVLEVPGAWPFTRGIHPTGYRGRLWTMRQFA